MIHRVKNAARRLRGHLPSRDPRRAPLKVSRKLPIFARLPDGRRMLVGFEDGYLHPTKGIRKGSVESIKTRWPSAC